MRYFTRYFLVLSFIFVFAGCGKGDGGQSPSLPCAASSTCTVTLTWNPVTTDTNGNPVTVGGYKIYWGTASGQYDHVVDAGPNTTCKIPGFGPGSYYFVATAYLPGYSKESGYSNEASVATALVMREKHVVIH